MQGMARYKFCCIYNVITSSIDIFFQWVITDARHDSTANASYHTLYHSVCFCDSSCLRQSYVSSKVPVTDAAAIAAYEKTLRGTNIYKYAES